MDNGQRREKIIELLHQNTQPIKGGEMAVLLGVSRQVIVQDIALLRANNKNILSTNKGYLLFDPFLGYQRPVRTIKVTHTDSQIQDELYTIVDYNGAVLDVVIEHKVYGLITVDLFIKSRQDVDEFVDKIRTANDRPLKDLTNNDHYHTIQADTIQILDAIENRLKEKGYA